MDQSQGILPSRIAIGLGLLLIFFATLQAQVPVRLSPGVAAQIQMQQTPVEVALPEVVTAKAEFDPPAARPGEKVLYRVSFEATRNSLAWPESLPASAGLELGSIASGQITRMEGNKYRPLTAFVCEAWAAAAGTYSVSNFTVFCDGKAVVIPAASLEVNPNIPADMPRRPRLLLQVGETNLFVGQPVRLRVLMPASSGNNVEALREVQFNCDGFMTDKTQTRQAVEGVQIEGQTRPAYVYETVATPMTTGRLKLSAQAFTAGRDFSGPITISGGQVTIPGGPPSYTLMLTESKEINVRPLPTDEELPGFTGAIGKFLAEPARLSTNRIRVGEPVHLSFGFRAEGNLLHYVPPALPASRDWQIIMDRAPGNGITFIPLTAEATSTPAIPFSAFDPAMKMFYDLTIPAQAVTVTGEGLPLEFRTLYEETNSQALKMSALELSPGKTTASLMPLQLQRWFVVLQLLPALGLIALWRWDERRRFLEAHPEIVRRRQARQALRREQRQLNKARNEGDGDKFIQHAAAAMRVAVAPHFPAEARALVGADVLSQLEDTATDHRLAATVRTVFAAADAQYAVKNDTIVDLATLSTEVDLVLKKLEAKL
jgi:hypothetical protein